MLFERMFLRIERHDKKTPFGEFEKISMSAFSLWDDFEFYFTYFYLNNAISVVLFLIVICAAYKHFSYFVDVLFIVRIVLIVFHVIYHYSFIKKLLEIKLLAALKNYFIEFYIKGFEPWKRFLLRGIILALLISWLGQFF